MDYLKVIEFISFVLTVIGALLISIPRKIGLYFFYSCWSFMELFCIFKSSILFLNSKFCFDFIGIYSWTKHGIK